MLNFSEHSSLMSRLSGSLGTLGRRLFPVRKALLLYPGENDAADISADTVLVIPPCDYWVRKAQIGVKSEKEALKYAPALFDLGEGYRYEAQKAGEGEYLLIAYEPEQIRRKWLEEERYAPIAAIAFAQWVFGPYNTPFLLSDGRCLGSEDGIVVEIDSSYLSVSPEPIGGFLSHPHSVRTLRTDAFAPTELSARTLKTTLVLLAVIVLNMTANAIMTHHSIQQTSEQIHETLTTSSLPETSMERQAILQSLRKKDEAQERLRERIKTISALSIEASAPAAVPAATNATDGIVLIPGSKPGEQNRVLIGNQANSGTLVAGEGMTMLTYDGTSIAFTVQTIDADALASLKATVSKRFKKALITEENNKIEVRIK